MLSNRLHHFNAFYASLGSLSEQVFLSEAQEQRWSLQQDDPERPVSLLDCLENVWDRWIELGWCLIDRPNLLSDDARIIASIVNDPERIARQSNFLDYNN